MLPDSPDQARNGTERDVSRRDLIRKLIGLGMLATGGFFLRRLLFPRRLEGESLRTFEAFLDTLLPESDLPSWRATGVMPRLLEELSAERAMRRALAEGWSGWMTRRGAGRGPAFPRPTKERALRSLPRPRRARQGRSRHSSTA
jgi:hypothetical protein